MYNVIRQRDLELVTFLLEIVFRENVNHKIKRIVTIRSGASTELTMNSDY